MFTRTWNYIVDKFSTNKKPQPPVLLPFYRPPPQSPLQSPQSKPTPPFSLAHHQEPGQTQPELRVVVKEEVLGEMESAETGVDEQDVIDQIRLLGQQLRKMQLQERKLKEAQEKTAVLDPDRLPRLQKERQKERLQANEFRKEYEMEIVNFRQCKYSKEQCDFPLIPFESFQLVKGFWRDKKRSTTEIKKTKMECVDKLTFKAMGGLEPGDWLNDEVININIELLEKQLPREGVKLFNTFFATTTLTKTENMINRFLKKKGVDRSHVLIMPVNMNKVHWIFACLHPQQHTLTVYDSLRKPSEQYLADSIFKNALKFVRWFYDAEFRLVVSEDYPQQNNGYDCGVFMLMGIRDVLRGREWSFKQGDMRFKRFQLGCEVYQEELMLNEN